MLCTFRVEVGAMAGSGAHIVAFSVGSDRCGASKTWHTLRHEICNLVSVLKNAFVLEDRRLQHIEGDLLASVKSHAEKLCSMSKRVARSKRPSEGRCASATMPL